jgi:hypothetical protein
VRVEVEDVGAHGRYKPTRARGGLQACRSTGGLAAEGCAARGAPVARRYRSAQVDAGGAPDRRLECAFARRFCARRIFARSVRFSRRACAAALRPARGRLVCTFSTRPSLIGTTKPTDESAGIQEICVKNTQTAGHIGQRSRNEGAFLANRHLIGGWVPESRVASAPERAPDPAQAPARAPARAPDPAPAPARSPGRGEFLRRAVRRGPCVR